MVRRKPSSQRFERRLLSGGVIAGLAVALVAGRLIQVQIVEAGSYREEARSQRERTLELPAARGAILDRHGKPLAYTIPGDRRLTREARRFYPRGSLAAQLIGFVSKDGCGLEGIEYLYQSLLSGRPGSRVVGINAHHLRYTIPGSRTRPPRDGATLVLAIDATAQAILERELQRCVERSGALSATAILLEPRTGDILAMASFPTYDPQAHQSSTPQVRRNRAITDIHEPGSTFKLVTAAACLDEGLARRGTLVESAKELSLAGGQALRDDEDHGWVTLEETLIQSVNTATAQLARRLGPERLYQYARAFGFGCVTGIDLPGEVSGILRRPANWSGRSLETISIGQEVAVTPLQMICAYGAIANDGVLMKPRIVREIRDGAGRTLRAVPTRRVRRVVSRETARTLTEILAGVVESGTGSEAGIPGIPVAGKTGTAQRIDPRTGRYDPRRHVASFVGFVPAHAPSLVGIVVVDRPSGVGYGGQVAAPCFRRIIEGTILARRAPLDFTRPALRAET